MRFRRPRGEQVFGELLARERSGHGGQNLLRRGCLAIDVARLRIHFAIREQRFAGVAIQHPDETRFCGLGHRVDQAAIALHLDERGSGWEIAIPEVMAYAFEMPEPLARVRLQRQNAVREQIVAEPIGAVKIE